MNDVEWEVSNDFSGQPRLKSRQSQRYGRVQCARQPLYRLSETKSLGHQFFLFIENRIALMSKSSPQISNTI